MEPKFSYHGCRFPIAATKMSGTGNDFIIIDHRHPFIPPEVQSEFARLVCRRKFSAGADGLILIENNDECDFQWQFYNADGSSAEMCGNGARCAARYAHDKNIAPAEMSFKTKAGVIAASMVGEAVKIKLTSPENICRRQHIILDGVETVISSVNTGVPHVVYFVDDIKKVPVDHWGRIIRYHELFQPAGTNVNFVQVLSDKTLAVRTYERGVEGETLACGTGAVASAVMAHLENKISAPVEVVTSGGEKLVIHLHSKGGEVFDTVFLEGPAHFIYEAELSQEAFL